MITSAELAAVTGPEIMILRLVLLGENVFEICLPQCIFDFGFPFGQVCFSVYTGGNDIHSLVWPL